MHQDDVFVFGMDIQAGTSFTRITALSLRGIAIVGVNIRVMCTNADVDCTTEGK